MAPKSRHNRISTSTTLQSDKELTSIEPKATHREWLGLAVLVLPCIVVVMDFSVLNLAVPSLTAALQPTPTQLLWIVDIYGFLLAGSLITLGNLGDRIGRRKLLMIGSAAFGIASLVAAFSVSAEMLIAARAFLGIAGATLAPSTLSLIRNMFHDKGQQMQAIAIWGSGFAAGGVIGPVIGGVLLKFFWWGSVFLVSIPVMLLVLLVGPRLLPESRNSSPGILDLLSAALSIGAVLGIIYGLKQIAQDGLGWIPVLFVVAGLVAGIFFVRRQLHLDQPLMDLTLFRIPAFTATLIMVLSTGVVMYGLAFYFAQYLQLVLGLSALEAGLSIAPSTLAIVFSSLVAPVLARRLPQPVILISCLLLSAVGFAVLSQIKSFDLPILIGLYVLISLGMGPLGTLSSTLIVNSAPPEHAGAAAALSETSGEFGGALGLALLGSIGVAIYRNTMAGAASLVGLKAESVEAAKKTLADAVKAAELVPGDKGTALLGTARASFTEAFVVVVIISAVLLVLAAVMLGVVTIKKHSSGKATTSTPSTETGNRN